MPDLNSLPTAFPPAECVCTRAVIRDAITHLADKISARVSGLNPLVLCVMKGGLVFCTHLIERLQFELELDYVHLARYRNETTGGKVEWVARPRTDLRGRVVLLVDDIWDEGETLAVLRDYCLASGAASLITAVLVNKVHDRKTEGVIPDYIGLEVEDRYVFGCGMDFRGQWRNLPDIYALIDES